MCFSSFAFFLALPYFDSTPDSLLKRNTQVKRLALRVYYLHRGVVSGIRLRIRKVLSRLPPSRGRVRDISCAREQQQGTTPSMFSICNVDYIQYATHVKKPLFWLRLAAYFRSDFSRNA